MSGRMNPCARLTVKTTGNDGSVSSKHGGGAVLLFLLACFFSVLTGVCTLRRQKIN